MRVINYNAFFFLLTILLLASCNDKKSEKVNQKTEINHPDVSSSSNKLEYSSIKNKFKYFNLDKFSRDTIDWDKRKYFYTQLDSLEFFQVYQDSTKKQYLGGYPESSDLDFFYSKQESKRGLLEFTVLTQRESESCERILYNIYSLDKKLISSFRVAGYCGDGGYYETAAGKFLNDSIYELLSEDNYKTDDVDKPNIITFSKTITIIKRNGTIVQTDKTVKTIIK